MAKVYVSSTKADLEAERQAVIDWLVAARNQPVHSYVASSETVRDSCLADVDTCDLYVLILGHRYGFQPPRDNPEGLSITHLEFRRAGQSGIPRIALLRTSIPDASSCDVEDSQQAALASAFRAEVTREVRAAEFRDLLGLIQGLSTGVLAALDKLSPAGRALRLAPRPPFLAGREEMLAELVARLAGGDGPGPRTVVLSGLGGAGKTSVALEYAHRHLAEVGVTWQFAAEDPAVLAAGFGELAAQLGARDGAGDPGTLTARANLAGWTGDAGDPVTARDQSAALVPIRERVSGPDHPETLFARHHRAYWTGKAGNATEARDQFAALLADRERVLGSKHPDTLLTRANLASWTGQAGDPAGARDQYAALLPIRTQILGPQHPRTLTTRDSLARWTGEAGDAAGARDQYAALLAIMEQVFAPEDPRTLTTRGSLARWTGEAGDAAGARDRFEALLQIADQVLGHEHSLTRAARTNLVAWTAKADGSSGLT